MRLTIERLRTVVLAAGILLLAALVTFLVIGKWKRPFNAHDLPKRLGVDIQQEANGFTHAEFRAGKSVYKMTASRVEQLKDGHYRLHAVRIELYGAQGTGVDSIEGNEFDYDQHAGIAQAAGPVEIVLTRPADTPAVIPGGARQKALGDMPRSGPLAAAMADAQHGVIRIKTSGLIFDQKSGVVHTAARVEFAMLQGSGSAIGAVVDSQNRTVVLDHAVAMQTHRGAEPVSLTAQHAAFNRDDQVCRLTAAAVSYRDGTAHAADTTVQFNDGGSAKRLDATHGFSLATASGGKLAAPTASLVFGPQNKPAHGHLEGGVAIDEVASGRATHGTAPTAEIEFASGGLLRSAHLAGGVRMVSDEASPAARTHRLWLSPATDLAFRNAPHGQLSLASMHGIGGVTVTSETARNGVTTPARFAADDVTGAFGPDSTLTAMTGLGRASMQQTTQQGAQQTMSGDRLEAHFAPATRPAAPGRGAAAQIDSATVTGHVVLVQQPRAGAAQLPLRATAQHALFEGAGAWLHLTGAPHVDNGGLQLSADRLDVSQESGDAFAHGNVKASWLGDSARGRGQTFGGQGPAHVVSAEAQLHQSTGEATFQGQARLWQQANSIWAPLITLDRARRLLTAHTSVASDPVRVVLVSSALDPRTHAASTAPNVIRLRGGDLRYSDAERKATMHAGAAGLVVAESAGAVTRSSQVDVTLLPAGNHADAGSAQVDRVVARGHVTLESAGRRGWGEQLVYRGDNSTYTLTGTPAAPPRMTDPARGTVSGETLIFNSRDDSVIVEGGGHATTTGTSVQKRRQ